MAGGNGGFVQFCLGHLAGNAQESIHGTLCVRGQHDQTLAGYTAVAAAVHVGVHAGGGQIVDEDIAGGIVGNLAGVIAIAAEIAGGHHGVAGRAATGLFVRLGFVCQGGNQFCLAGFVHQCHQALAHIHALKKGVADLDLRVYQGVAEGINVVFFRHGCSVF